MPRCRLRLRIRIQLMSLVGDGRDAAARHRCNGCIRQPNGKDGIFVVLPFAADLGSKWALRSLVLIEEKTAPLSRIVLANHSSRTFFHGASEASLYFRSHEIRMAEQWLSQSIRPNPRPSPSWLILRVW
eukprot:scaffold12986_cov148-Isochrysis_galbana.AAC.1